MFGYVFHDTNGRHLVESWRSCDTSRTFFFWHPMAGLLWERLFEEASLEFGGEKVPNWECLFVHRKRGLFLSVHVDDIEMAGKKQNMAPIWKKLMNMWTLTNPHHFLTMCTKDALSVNANWMKQLLNNIRRCLNHVKADFLHSSHKRFPTILSCGKNGTALQIGFVSRLRLRWWSWGLKINFMKCLVYFGSRTSFQSVGCARNKLLLSRTDLQNLKSFL